MLWLYPSAVALLFGAPFYIVSRWKNPPETRLTSFIAACIVGVPLFLGASCNAYLTNNY